MTQQALTLKQSGVRWLWLALLVFVADIAIKLVVMNSMGYGWEIASRFCRFSICCTCITTAPHLAF